MLVLRPEEWWTMGVAALAAACCALLGVFLVLRRMSLLGDAISHAILPGLALAFIVTGGREVMPMFIGALVVGILTAFLSSALARAGRVPEDSAMGVVFSSLFALGVVLITLVARDVDLDPGCVLYGLIEFTPYDTVSLWGSEIPRAILVLGGMFLISLLFVLVLYKELQVLCFDPDFASVVGISVRAVHYLFVAVVAATAVSAFESVGSVLVVAMLVAPPAAAHLLTERLSTLIVLSLCLAVLSAVFGYLGALVLNTSVAGMMSVASGALVLAAIFFAPRHGLLSKLVHRFLLSLRIAEEDLLGLLYRQAERSDLPKTAGGPLPRLARYQLIRRGLLADSSLTPLGKQYAEQVVRKHRLWESFLAERFDVPPDHVHRPSEVMEHFISQELADELSAELRVERDPHGREIP